MRQPSPQTRIPGRRFLAGYFLLAALEGLGVLAWLFAIPPDPKNSIFLGFSLQRLAMLAATLLISGIYLALAWGSWRSKQSVSSRASGFLSSTFRRRLILSLSGIIFCLGWLLCWTPASRFGDNAAYFTRFFPLLLWLTAVSGQTFLPLAIVGRDFHPPQQLSPGAVWKTHRPFLLASACLLLFWGIAAATRFGVDPENKVFGWGRPGTPILLTQVALALALGMGWMAWESTRPVERSSRTLWQDAVICLVIWLAATVIWNSAPFLTSYFMPASLPPNYDHTPYSDALYYDTAAQSILIGRGYAFHQEVSRPLYVFFLALLHAAAGQNYDSVVAMQIGFLALFPAGLYLLGKLLYGRNLGIILAALAILKEWNAIQTTPWLEVSDSKMLLTDLPTAAMIALFCLVLLHLLKRPRDLRLAAAAGGVLGLSLLLRLNTIIFLPLAWIGLGWASWKNKRQFYSSAGLFTLVVFLTVLPWMARNQVVTGSFGMENVKLQRIILDRYLPPPATAYPSSPSTPSSPSSLSTPSTPSTPQPIPTLTPAAATPTPAGSNMVTAATPAPPPTPVPSPPQSLAAQVVQLVRTRGIGLLDIVGNQFAHNEVLSIFILPVTPVNLDLKMLIQQNAFFAPGWKGPLSPTAALMVLVNLLLIALGIDLAWRKTGFAGVVPLLIHLAYNFTNGLARISGWRFLLPVDWVVYLYYALGLLQIITWVLGLFGVKLGSGAGLPEANPSDSPARSRMSLQVMGLSGIFLLAGMALASPDFIARPRYPDLTSQQALAKLVSQPGFIEAGLSAADLESFLKQPGAAAVYQRALYPRFYPAGKGEEEKAISWYVRRSYPRLGMTLTGGMYVGAILRTSSPPEVFPHPSDVIVVGCREGNLIDALLVMNLTPPGKVYLRSPDSPRACPLPAP